MEEGGYVKNVIKKQVMNIIKITLNTSKNIIKKIGITS